MLLFSRREREAKQLSESLAMHAHSFYDLPLCGCLFIIFCTCFSSRPPKKRDFKECLSVCIEHQHHRAQAERNTTPLALCVLAHVCEACPDTFLTVVVHVRYWCWHKANTDLCYNAAAQLKLQVTLDQVWQKDGHTCNCGFHVKGCSSVRLPFKLHILMLEHRILQIRRENSR